MKYTSNKGKATQGGKHKVTLLMTPAGYEHMLELARTRGLSMGALFEELVRYEHERLRQLDIDAARVGTR